MTIDGETKLAVPQPHAWLHNLGVSYLRGVEDPILDEVAENLLLRFEKLGHQVQDPPTNDTDVIFSTAPFGSPIPWRDAVIFNIRRDYDLDHLPTIYTLVHATPEEFQERISNIKQALASEPPDLSRLEYEGLAPEATRVLVEQGLRGGPILALARIAQAQAKSIRIILIIGDEHPIEAYQFDLVGAHPRTSAENEEFFYTEMALRIATYESTAEITNHAVVGEKISQEDWNKLKTPARMHEAALQFDERDFFTEMVRIADIVKVPAVEEAISSQYSEGCFATWDHDIEGLVSTVTGSARPVDKGNITDDDLAVIVGVQPDGSGALVRHVEGKRNDPPSSEAVELINMDKALPRIILPETWGIENEVPIVRSKLHGHRGIRAYNPDLVEHVHLDDPYYHYLVSCSTEAQSQAIKDAFARSESLQQADDPRNIVFTVLPGHGVVIVEKWVPDKKPFQVIWEAFDAGDIVVENIVPQGPFRYVLLESGKMELELL